MSEAAKAGESPATTEPDGFRWIVLAGIWLIYASFGMIVVSLAPVVSDITIIIGELKAWTRPRAVPSLERRGKWMVAKQRLLVQ